MALKPEEASEIVFGLKRDVPHDVVMGAFRLMWELDSDLMTRWNFILDVTKTEPEIDASGRSLHSLFLARLAKAAPPA